MWNPSARISYQLAAAQSSWENGMGFSGSDAVMVRAEDVLQRLTQSDGCQVNLFNYMCKTR
jgi:hypothetical protein